MQLSTIGPDCDVEIKFTHEGYFYTLANGIQGKTWHLENLILKIYQHSKKGVKVPHRVFEKLHSIFKEVLKEIE